MKIARIFLSARKLCRSFQVWERFYPFDPAPLFGKFRSNRYRRFVVLKEFFSVINVKSIRGFALSVDGESSDGFVNRGGKITSNLHVCLHTF